MLNPKAAGHLYCSSQFDIVNNIVIVPALSVRSDRAEGFYLYQLFTFCQKNTKQFKNDIQMTQFHDIIRA